MTERYRLDIEEARKRLADFCRDGLKQLVDIGYRGSFWIGEVDGEGESFSIKNRKIYGTRHPVKVIDPYEIPFEKFGYIDKGETDSLVRAAEIIEGTLERSRRARARSSKPALQQSA